MALFDPDTGKLVDPNALRSIQFNGQGMRIPVTTIDRATDTKTVEVLDDNSGRVAGTQTYHGTGQVDANVFAVGQPMGAAGGTPGS